MMQNLRLLILTLVAVSTLVTGCSNSMIHTRRGTPESFKLNAGESQAQSEVLELIKASQLKAAYDKMTYGNFPKPVMKCYLYAIKYIQVINTLRNDPIMKIIRNLSLSETPEEKEKWNNALKSQPISVMNNYKKRINNFLIVRKGLIFYYKKIVDINWKSFTDKMFQIMGIPFKQLQKPLPKSS